MVTVDRPDWSYKLIWLNSKKNFFDEKKLEWGHSNYLRKRITELSQKVFMLRLQCLEKISKIPNYVATYAVFYY